MREALITLCSEGVLKNLPRYGYEVVRLTEEDVRGILSFRLVLEGGFLRLGDFSRARLEELRRLDASCQKATDDLWRHWEANTQFHLALIACSGNQYAWQHLKSAMGILKRAYAQFYWGKWNSFSPAMDVRCHCGILDALEKGDRTRRCGCWGWIWRTSGSLKTTEKKESCVCCRFAEWIVVTAVTGEGIAAAVFKPRATPLGAAVWLRNVSKKGGAQGLADCKSALIGELTAWASPTLHIEELHLLNGAYVNLEYPLPGGQTVQFLADNQVYWGNQVEIPGSERC